MKTFTIPVSKIIEGLRLSQEESGDLAWTQEEPGRLREARLVWDFNPNDPFLEGTITSFDTSGEEGSTVTVISFTGGPVDDVGGDWSIETDKDDVGTSAELFADFLAVVQSMAALKAA